MAKKPEGWPEPSDPEFETQTGAVERGLQVFSVMVMLFICGVLLAAIVWGLLVLGHWAVVVLLGVGVLYVAARSVVRRWPGMF